MIKQEGLTFTFVCPHDDGCGQTKENYHYPWSSNGWPSAELAQMRGNEHLEEHFYGQLMSPLDEFREQNGVEVNASGIVVIR